MKILVTGNYETDYNRTLIILDGFRELGHEVIEYSYAKRNREASKVIQNLSLDCDFIFLPCFTHKCVPFVKSNITKPLIFDPLISKYLTNVHDYKKVFKYSLKAFRDFRRDKNTMSLADLVVSDTIAHIEYFTETFGISRDKFVVAEVGVNCEDFKPAAKEICSPLKVGFYGGFIPLQGALNIIDAIEILKNEDIEFELIGNGYQYELAKKKIKKLNLNVSLPGWVKYDELADKINEYDICLGIFGETLKSDLVIPNKVFHYAACGKCMITKNSPAIKEAFNDGKNIILCEFNGKDIAKSIMALKSNPERIKLIGDNARELMVNDYNPKKIAGKIISAYREYISL
jgi:glycosyltransferase involved in cell wall biosynthesis